MALEWTTRAIDAPNGNLFDAIEISRFLGISRDTFDALVKEGEFPRPLQASKGTKVWGWKDVAYYVLRMELAPRLGVAPSEIGGKSSEARGKSSEA